MTNENISILLPGLAPITSQLCLIEANESDEAIRAFSAVLASEASSEVFLAQDVTIEERLRRLLPLSLKSPDKFMMTSCHNSWSAVFCNQWMINDSLGVGLSVARVLRSRCVLAAYVPDQADRGGRYGLARFRLYDASEPGRPPALVRSIEALNDGGYKSRWRTMQDGSPLAQERHLAIGVGRGADFLTIDVLLTLLDRLGIQASDPSFYEAGSAAVVTEVRPTAEHIGLHEARQELRVVAP